MRDFSIYSFLETLRKNTFLGWLLLASVLPLIIAIYLLQSIAENALKEETVKVLSTAADKKSNQIDSFIQNNIKNISLFAINPTVVNSIAGLEDSNPEKHEKAVNLIKPYLKYAQETFYYTDILVFSSSGQLLFSLTNTGLIGENFLKGNLKTSDLGKTIDHAITLLEPQLSDLAYMDQYKEPQLYVAAPVLDKLNLVGVLVGQMSNAEIEKVINDTQGLGLTGETIVGTIKNNIIEPAVSLRHADVASFMAMSKSLGEKMLKAFTEATQGIKGSGSFEDYRGKKVLAVWMPIPYLHWGMLIKMDVDEAFSDLYVFRRQLLLLSFFSIAMVIIASFLISLRLQKAENTLIRLLHELKNTQIQLIQSEKMSSLGILTAGIAHEINNAVNCIHTGLQPLRKNIEDYLQIINQYSEVKKKPKPMDELENIDKFKEEIDFNYTINETQTLLNAIQSGAKRTATIVKDLRNVTRLDEDEIKRINIHENINSILTLLKPSYKDKVEIVKEYSSEIYEIECWPGQMNQAIMNILMNAIEAIPDKGKVTIKTEKDQNRVKIKIIDTGRGIADDIKEKIFVPFFTTKPVGQGAGLGLSVALDIVNNHHGTIELKTELMKGSEFTINIPVSQYES